MPFIHTVARVSSILNKVTTALVTPVCVVRCDCIAIVSDEKEICPII